MNGGWIQYAAFGLNGRNLRMEKVFQNYDLKQWQSWLLEQYRNENGNGMLEGRVCRIVEMFLNPEMERYRKSAEQPVLPEAGYERLRCLTCYAVCIRTVFSELATSAKSPAELAASEPEPLDHAGYKLWKTQAERDLFPDDARLVAAVLGPYPFNAREDIQATMMRIAFLSSEKAIKFVTPDLDLELQSLMLYFTRALSGDCVLTSLNYNELSALGLVYKINKEVLHPLGLALHYNVDDGISEGVYISPDRVYEYSYETSGEEEEKLHRFLQNRHRTLDKLELEKAGIV